MRKGEGGERDDGRDKKGGELRGSDVQNELDRKRKKKHAKEREEIQIIRGY